MADRHDWNSWQDYLNAHQRRLRDYEFFIVEDRLGYQITDVAVSFEGALICHDGLEIHVSKTLDVRYLKAQPQVRTRRYAYHVQQRAAGPNETETIRLLFRYDNVHEHPQHLDPHHRHQYEPDGIHERLPVEHLGAERWPLLSDVIAETHAWWLETGSERV